MVNLFCLPFAGGNKYSYRAYEGKASPFLKIIPLEYPGRGERMREPLLRNMKMMVEDMYEQLSSRIDAQDYAIYGHSMGAFVSLMLTRKIVDEGCRPPVHLFLTGTTGPVAYVKEKKKRHLLSREEFIQEIKDLDGCPEEVLQHEDLLNYFEPILRADFEVAETYEYEEHVALDIPLTVITGSREKMDAEDIYTWQKETKHIVDFRCMEGTHFFIFNHTESIISIITEKLFNLIKSASHE